MVSINPRQLHRPRRHGDRFRVNVIEFAATPGRHTEAHFRDCFADSWDRVFEHAPWVHRRTGNVREIAHVTTTQRVGNRIYKGRWIAHTLPRRRRFILRDWKGVPTVKGIPANKAMCRPHPTLIVRHYHDKPIGWVKHEVELDAAHVVLDFLEDRPDALELTHLSVVTTNGRIVKLGQEIGEAYDLMGIERRHWLDAWLGLTDRHYQRFADRQAALRALGNPEDDDDLMSLF